MSIQDYEKAYKLGKKEYQRRLMDGKRPTLKVLYEKNPNNTIFEDYLIIFDSVSDLTKLSETDFYNVFKKTFSPMVQIAENMGFKIWQP